MNYKRLVSCSLFVQLCNLSD